MVVRGLLFSALLLTSCGKTDTTPMHGTNVDSGTIDTGVRVYDAGLLDTGIVRDAGPTPFCEGTTKVEYNNLILEPLWATTSDRPLMSCCQVVVVRLHTTSQLGFDLNLLVRSMGLFQTGEHVLDTATSTIEVRVSRSSEPFSWPDQGVTGSIRVEGDPNSGGHWNLSLCIEVISGSMQGTRAFADGVAVLGYNHARDWGIWLTDTPLTAIEAARHPLETLPLADSPLLELMSIDFYQRSNHFVGLTGEPHAASSLRGQLSHVGVNGIPFVVTANGTPIYLGAFMTEMSSIAFFGPTVMVETITDRGFEISRGPGNIDLRDDPRIFSVLNGSGKLVP